MPKRKALEDDKAPAGSKSGVDEGDEESEDDLDMLDVDFEWFDLEPGVDFHGLKTLLRQMFDVDNQLFDLSELAEIMLSQPRLGSTVKCEGEESDPYAFIAVINFRQQSQKLAIRQLREYILSKSANIEGMQSLKPIFAEDAANSNVGVILMERFVNMPHQIVPLLYNVLIEEIDKHIAEGTLPGPFSHYVVISKTYTEVASEMDSGSNPPSKKNKKNTTQQGLETFYFHPEDEVLQKHAIAFGGFDFTTKAEDGSADAKRTFQELGVRPMGHLILLEAEKLKPAVKAVGEYLGADSSSLT